MLGALGAAVAKELRLLVRDRAGLVFLTLAPIVVMTVAGLSLASLYGADPRGTTAYTLPVADEDGGRIGRLLARRLASEPSVRVEPVHDASAARALVRAQRAGAALAVPAGTTDALRRGRPARLVLYTDPVKYLEVARVRAIVQELRHGLEATARARAARRLETARAAAADARARLLAAGDRLRADVDDLRRRRGAARAGAIRDAGAARARVEAAVRSAAERRVADARVRVVAELAPLREFLARLDASRREFAAWAADARARAGRLADRIPAPPAPPAVPPEVAALASTDDATLARRLVPDVAGLPAVPAPEPPSVPALPDVGLPTLPEPPDVRLPGPLRIREASATGAPRRLNTFDQNVPGFSVTFLLLGMLFGVSLGLLDERDWGTLDRLRAMPAPLAATLVGKLLARLVVGVLQMVVLFAVGRVAFGVSLGPEPWALLLPTVGIVFAGTAFGLVVAGVARTRESVLPIGSIVIVSMAAVGGCWWPIDLEPPWMRSAALAFPTTWAMRAFNDLMIRRQAVGAALVPTAVLAAYGLAYLAVGLILLRRRALRG